MTAPIENVTDLRVGQHLTLTSLGGYYDETDPPQHAVVTGTTFDVAKPFVGVLALDGSGDEGTVFQSEITAGMVRVEVDGFAQALADHTAQAIAKLVAR